MKTHHSIRSHGRSRSAWPQVEFLEDRLCLSCRFIVGNDTLLISEGPGPAPNNIGIVDDGTDGAGNIQVTCDGVAKSFDSINNILVRTGRGKDSVDYRFATSTLIAERNIDIELGKGNDRASLLHDQLDLLCHLKIQIDGQAGNDDVEVRSGIGLGKDFDLEINGGTGTDTLSGAIYIVRPIIGAMFDIDINGNEHDDMLALTLENFDNAPGDGTVDGGPGFDTCVASPGVNVINCEA